MIKTHTGLRTVGMVVAALLVAVGTSTDGVVEAQSQGHGLTGTWFVRAGGFSGFFTYGQDGTVTGVDNTLFGGIPQTLGRLQGTYHGVWHQAGGGFETMTFHMAYEPGTGDVVRIVRFRVPMQLDPGLESATGMRFVSLWDCPTPVTCPDPNVDPPDVPEFTPPGNIWTQTRVRLP